MNVMLVEDNRYILESLAVGVDYAALGISSVFTATNMEEALGILEAERVDIVLTDIEMHGGSGIDLLEWINQNQPAVVTIFCTGFANFDYAKKAVELRCFDYYLKPIQFEELEAIFKRAIAEVKKRARTEEKSRMGEFWLHCLNENKKHFWMEALILIYTYAEEELEELSKSRHLPYARGERFTLGILKFFQEDSKVQRMDYMLAQFALRNMLEEMLGKHGIAVEACFKSDFDAWILVAKCNEEVDLGAIFQRALARLEQVLQCQAGMCFSREQIFEEIRSRYLELEQFFLNGGCLAGQAIWHQGTSQEADRQRPEESAAAVEQIKNYIDAHYQEKICREDMGGGMYYNTAYLANVFKKKYGQSMGNYLMERRMERAKELLSASSMSVSEVAALSGYDNFAYFSRLFKKKTGYAPKDYKQSFGTAEG